KILASDPRHHPCAGFPRRGRTGHRRPAHHGRAARGRRRPTTAAARPSQSQRRQASPRVLLAPAAVLVAVAVGGGVRIAVAGSGSSSLKRVGTVRTLLRGIPPASVVNAIQLLSG